MDTLSQIGFTKWRLIDYLEADVSGAEEEVVLNVVCSHKGCRVVCQPHIDTAEDEVSRQLCARRSQVDHKHQRVLHPVCA